MTTLSILQWNILADRLSGAHPNLGGFDGDNMAEVLNWETRKNKIMAVLNAKSPDIITLQECDHFYDFIKPELEKDYIGFFMPKPLSGSNCEGCCIFVRRCYRHATIDIDQCSCINYTTPGGDYVANQGAIILRLNINLYRSVIVATTHLKAEKTARGEQIRQDQIQQLFSYIGTIATPTDHIIIAGDLNAMPIADAEIGAPLTYETIKNAGFRSVFNTTEAVEPFITTQKSRGGKTTGRCIDYILHSGALVPKTYYRINTPISKQPSFINYAKGVPDDECIETSLGTNVIYRLKKLPNGFSYGPPSELPVIPKPVSDPITENLPNANWPSDHACLYASFAIP